VRARSSKASAREIANGVAILGNPEQPAGLWARVAGDALDLAALGRLASDRWNPRRENVGLAIAAVAGVTLIDIAAALLLRERADRARRTARRTRVDPQERPKAIAAERNAGRSAGQESAKASDPNAVAAVI
jgi:hypothetical protein